MATWDRQSYYYSGQGVVMVGDLDEDNALLGLTPLGNVTASSAPPITASSTPAPNTMCISPTIPISSGKTVINRQPGGISSPT